MNETDSEPKTNFGELPSAVDFLCGLIKDALDDLNLDSLREERIFSRQNFRFCENY